MISLDYLLCRRLYFLAFVVFLWRDFLRFVVSQPVCTFALFCTLFYNSRKGVNISNCVK